MTENQILNLSWKYVNYLTFMMVLLAFLNCTCCIAQGIQKEGHEREMQQEVLQGLPLADSAIYNQSKNGEKDGLWKEYHVNGRLKSEGSYTDGLKDDLHREWGDNGILLVEGFYAKGKANGLMKWFHEGGHLAGKGNMIDGVREGPWKICDIQENEFCIEAHFKNGKRDGIWKIYHESARDKLWKEQIFKEDKMVSEKCWDEHGKVIQCE